MNLRSGGHLNKNFTGQQRLTRFDSSEPAEAKRENKFGFIYVVCSACTICLLSTLLTYSPALNLNSWHLFFSHSLKCINCQANPNYPEIKIISQYLRCENFEIWLHNLTNGGGGDSNCATTFSGRNIKIPILLPEWEKHSFFQAPCNRPLPNQAPVIFALLWMTHLP